MDSNYRTLSPEEVFYIFKEEHRLCSPFNVGSDPMVDLKMDSSIDEWRMSMDLLPLQELGEYLNEEFEIHITAHQWKSTFEPSESKCIKDVCQLISSHAKVESIKPIKVFGKECLSYSLFKSIKRNLHKRGVDTTNLKPSSLIEPYLKNYFGEFIEQINKNFTGVIPEIRSEETKLSKLNSLIWIVFTLSILAGIFWTPLLGLAMILFLIGLFTGIASKKEFENQNNMMYIPEVKTFRELVERIIEKKYNIH